MERVNLESDRDNKLPFSYDKSVFNRNFGSFDAQSYRVLLGRYLPSFALDISENEGCGWTYPDLHTYLIDGITVGGYTIRDEHVVYNVKLCWDYILNHSDAGFGRQDVTAWEIKSFHQIVMRDLLPDARVLGALRRTPVRISGADEWSPLNGDDLEAAFNAELPLINATDCPVERAIIAQLWISYRQFFADGNKRVARLLSNRILAQDCVGIFVVPIKGHREFTKLLCDFYNTADATELIDFILDYCLITFTEDGDIVDPKRL